MITTVMALALLGGVLSGVSPAQTAAGPDAADGGPQVLDPQGDAYETSADYATGWMWEACQQAKNNTPCETLANVPSPGAWPYAGTPAQPAFDILSVLWRDDPTTLTIEMTVASIGESYDASYPTDGRNPYYIVCWVALEFRCGQSVAVMVSRGVSGEMNLQGDVALNGECNAWQWCNWATPVTVVPGAPGKIVWSVPRALLLDPDASQLDGRLSSGSAYYDNRERDDVQTLGVNGSGLDERRILSGQITFADYAGADVDYAFATPRQPEEIASTPWTTSVRGVLFGEQDERVDILGVGLSDNATHFSVEVQLGEVQPPFTDPVWVDMYIGAPDGTMGWLGVYLRGDPSINGVESYAVVCTMPSSECDATMRNIDVDVEIRPGAPGSVVAHWRRSELGSPAAGDMPTLVAADAGRVVARQLVESAVVNATTTATPTVDWFGYSWPWRFTVDTIAEPVVKSIFRDAIGDARLPVEVLGSPSTFDITSLEAEGVSPTTSRLTIGLKDLSRVVVPHGYDAVLYAVAVETDRGAFMAGYYKADSTTDKRQEFFCAPDVDVFPETKRDPQEVVWQPITGVLKLANAPSTGQAGSSTAGSISFIVPHSCLGDPPEGPVTARRIGAATFLLGGPATDVHEVDEVKGAEPVTLGTAVRIPPTSDWWADPVWNVVGIAIAVGGGALALATRQRRRTVLAREIRAVDETHAKHRTAPALWKKAMADRRTHAAEQLRSGKLRPDELLVVERRIDLLAHELPPEAPPAPPELEVGTVLNERYRVERLLGEGGQGRALLARDEKLTRQVVLKTLRTADMDPQTKRLLLAEARLAGSLDHPNVVRVHDVVENPRSAVVVMEYVPGGTLRGLLQREGRLAPTDAVRALAGILEGLAAAHARGIVHRDVKPENVLLAKDGTPKLSDFGAATESRPDATIRPLAAGTLAYMSPEQVRGAVVDARSDLYSAAALMHELLSGQPYVPIAGLDDFQVRAAILEATPQLQLPDGALAYSGFLLRALAKDPGARYQSATDMLAALRRVG